MMSRGRKILYVDHGRSSNDDDDDDKNQQQHKMVTMYPIRLNKTKESGQCQKKRKKSKTAYIQLTFDGLKKKKFH